MSKTVKEKIELVKTETAAATVQKIEVMQGEAATLQAAMMLGGIRVANSIAEATALQVMQALKSFQESKGYTSFGYDTFDKFLDNCPQSPMSKSQYYERRKLLSAEGDEVFQFMTALNVPMSTRKALKRGEIVIETDGVRVGDEVINFSQEARIRSVLKSLVDKTTTQAQTIERGKLEIKAKAKQIAEAQASASVRASEDSDSEPGQIYMRLLSGFANLEREIASLSAEQQKVLINEFTPGLKLALQSFVLFGLGEKQAATDDLDDLLAQAADEADD